jgi:two-component system sensor histidine kinase QseC
LSRSIRWRLLALLLAVLVPVWGGAVFLLQYHARREVARLLDTQLAQLAVQLVVSTRHEIDEDDLKHLERNVIPAIDPCLTVQVWSRDGRLLARTDGAPLYPLLPAASLGYADVVREGVRWRALAVTDPERGDRVDVAQCSEERQAAIGGMIVRVLTPLLWALPLLVGLLWLGIGGGLAPLGRLARELAARDHRRLDPIPAEEVPREVMPLVQSLNDLFRRLDAAYLQQRRFTADAAHELRTPLAGIKTQAEVAVRSTTEPERRKALEQVLQGVNRAVHLVRQLLVLARIDREATDLVFSNPDLHRLAVSVLSEATPSALSKGVELELDGEGPFPVRGNADLLAILLRNLVDNAIRYTPRGGYVLAKVDAEAGAVRFTVADSGPGIPPEERERVFARFYRVAGGAPDGSGLGLSIVQRIAELHGANVQLRGRDEDPGLLVEVRFPQPA